jgi:two-component system sensor histidine kinase BarA
MTGIDVIREIKKSALNKNTPVVALTAFTMKGDMQEFLANGCDYYLSKPYTTRALKELVKKIIKKKK